MTLDLRAMIDRAYQNHMEAQRQAAEEGERLKRQRIAETQKAFQKELDSALDPEIQKHLGIKLVNEKPTHAYFEWAGEPWSIAFENYTWTVARNHYGILSTPRHELQEPLLVELGRAQKKAQNIDSIPSSEIEIVRDFLATENKIRVLSDDLCQLEQRLKRLEAALGHSLGWDSDPFFFELDGQFYVLEIGESDCRHPVTIRVVEELPQEVDHASGN